MRREELCIVGVGLFADEDAGRDVDSSFERDLKVVAR